MKARQCITPGCPRLASSSRCNPCRYQQELASDAVRVAYRKKKADAKRRGIAFTITLEYFREFCVAHSYMLGKGRTKLGWHVDREKEHLGYVPGNLVVRTNSDNVTKSNNWRAYQRRLSRWYEAGGTGPVPPFVPATITTNFEYYRGQCISVVVSKPKPQTPSLPDNEAPF